MDDKISLSITRRKLTEIMLGLVGLFLAAGAVTTVLKYLWPQSEKKGTSSEVRIVSADEVPTGSSKLFNFNGKAAVLIHMPAGFRAFGAVCTHLGCVANWKADENLIFCPCHLGKFDPNTGAVISGPPPSPLPAIEVRVKDGAVYALNWKDVNYVNTLPMYSGAT